MASTYCVGTLSTKSGWETKSPQEALALHFTYWFTSRRNQGKVLGQVPSFYYLLMKFGTTPELLIEHTTTELGDYIKELFPQSEVSVTKEEVEGQSNNYRLIITARVVDNNNTYDLAQTVLVTGEKYKVLDKKRFG